MTILLYPVVVPQQLSNTILPSPMRIAISNLVCHPQNLPEYRDGTPHGAPWDASRHLRDALRHGHVCFRQDACVACVPIFVV